MPEPGSHDCDVCPSRRPRVTFSQRGAGSRWSPVNEQGLRILALNSLDARYGSTYRFRALIDLLRIEGHAVHAVEGRGSAWHRLLRAGLAALGSYDLLFTQKFNPVTLTAMAIARARAKPVLVDWDDFDPGLQGTTLKRWLSEACERLGPFLATTITTHSEPIRVRATTLGRNAHLVPQGYDDTLFFSDDRRREEARVRYGFGAKDRVVGHLCTLTHGGTLDLPTILDAWQEIRDPRVRFMLIGGGPLEAEVRRALEHRGLRERTTMTGLLPHEHVPDALRCLDVGVVFMSDTPANRARISFKVIEYLAVGVPVVGHVVGETARLFGRFVVATDRARLASAIVQCLEQPPRDALPWEVRNVLQHCTWQRSREALARAVASTGVGASCA